MKKKYFMFLVLTALMVPIVFSGGDKLQASYGTCGIQEYHKTKLDSLQINGIVTLDETTVLGAVQVNGQAEMKKSCIGGKMVMNGLLTAADTEFQSELSVASKKTTLEGCLVHSITVRETGDEGVEVVDLRKETIVSGSVIFESGQGEVWLSGDSAVKGEIRGAKVCIK